MYKVERAIIMAAGEGTRLRPITLETPKPLVKINGIPMIESVIQSLQKNKINEIYIVVGYLKEQFYYLKDKYSNITLLENKYYQISNNISSLYVARDYIKNAIILDGDQIIYNNDILSPYFDKSGYNAVWTSENTTEWLLTVENNTIVKCSRTGGNCGWRLYSVSRWSEIDAQKLKTHLEKEFEYNKNYRIYWDDIALFCYPNEYSLGIFEMNDKDMIEIDSIEELIDIDSSYDYLRR